MPTPYTTPTEELILAIATHPQLDPRCWEMIADAENIGSALKQALADVFPAEMRACHRIASDKEEMFWSVVADLIGRGFFRRKLQPAPPSTKHLATPLASRPPNERMRKMALHPVLGHPWWDEDTDFHQPLPADNYLLMSHTS